MDILIIFGFRVRERETDSAHAARERRGGDQTLCNEMSPFISG